MIENLTINQGFINWKYNQSEIVLEIVEAFCATEEDNLNLIRVVAGENYVATKVYYYSYSGVLKLFCDMKLGIIEWGNDGKTKKVNIHGIQEVLYSPLFKRILILCDGGKSELIGYNLEGDLLFKVNQPEGFKLLYFTWSNENVWVVCDGDKKNEDQYGRYRYNFRLDLNKGNLFKESLAY